MAGFDFPGHWHQHLSECHGAVPTRSIAPRGRSQNVHQPNGLAIDRRTLFPTTWRLLVSPLTSTATAPEWERPRSPTAVDELANALQATIGTPEVSRSSRCCTRRIRSSHRTSIRRLQSTDPVTKYRSSNWCGSRVTSCRVIKLLHLTRRDCASFLLRSLSIGVKVRGYN